MRTLVHISRADCTFHSALVTLLVVVVWNFFALSMHMVTLWGMNTTELTFLGTVTVTGCVLLPLYWKRVWWSYGAGIFFIILDMSGKVGIAASSHTLCFSWSGYSLSVIVFYAAALTGIYFSFISFGKLLPTKKRALLGVGGLAIVAVLAGGILWSHAGSIYWGFMYNNTIKNVDGTLQNLNTVDERIQYLMEVGDVPSLVAGIVVGDKLVWAQAYGGVSLDTVYMIGSVTKPFTATAVLQLYEQEVLDIDDDVNNYLPFPVRHPEYPDTPITIRMLLQHQSGLGSNLEVHERYTDGRKLRDWTARNLGWEYPELDPYPSLDTFFKEFLTPACTYYSPDIWTTSAPGTGYNYSNLGYDVLGYVVEQVTHKPFPEYLKENIWDPLNMTRTGFRAADFVPDNAIPYERMYGLLSKTNVELPLYDRPCIGAGGIKSTVPDLAQFLIAHMNCGRHPNGYQLLTPETLELMHEQESSAATTHFMTSYGMGWKHRSTTTCEYFYLHDSQGHSGGTGGYTCQMWMVETDKGSYGIIFVTNIYTYFKGDPLWMMAWNYKVQDVLLQEALTMFTQTLTEES